MIVGKSKNKRDKYVWKYKKKLLFFRGEGERGWVRGGGQIF